MITNLDILRAYFPKSDFDLTESAYNLDGEYFIQWLGEGESFTVDRLYLDHDVGYVTGGDLFDGDLLECLEYMLKITGSEATITQEQRDAYARLRS